MKLKWMLSLFLSCFMGDDLKAQLMAIPSRTSLEAFEKGQSIKVFNKGDTPLYLEAKLYVDNPGHTPELQTPIGEIPRPQIMFNPTRISLGAKQERDIHLIALKAPAQETLYRLYITPVTQTKITGQSDKEKEMALTVGVAYGVLIHHLPEKSLQTRGWKYECLKKVKRSRLQQQEPIQTRFLDLKSSNSKESLSRALNVYPGTPVIFPRIKQLTGQVFDVNFKIDCL